MLGVVSRQRVSARERHIKCPSLKPKADSIFVPQSDTASAVNCSKEEACFQGKCLLFPFKAVLHPADQRYLSPCKITTNLCTQDALHFMGTCYDGSFVFWGKRKVLSKDD